MEPQIGLAYSSQSGNGILGMGCNITGVSAITRVPTNLFNDESIGIDPVDFDDNDQLALDGQRMFMLSVNQTDAGDGYGPYVEFRTEVENFARVRAYGFKLNTAQTWFTNEGYPTFFKVWTKSGQVIDYGTSTSNALLKLNGSFGYFQILNWYISKVKDVNGNYMTYNYSADNTNNETLLKNITYTANDLTTPSLAAYETVEFVYKNRLDKNTVYIGGQAVSQTQLLSFITINGIQKYSFAYSTDFLTNLNSSNLFSKLIEIDEYGEVSGIRKSYNPIRLNWNNASLSFTETSLQTAETGNKYFGDFNGDGLQDALSITPHTSYSVSAQITYNNSGIFGAANTPEFFSTTGSYSNFITSYFNNFIPFDFDGDGNNDLALVQQINSSTSTSNTITPYIRPSYYLQNNPNTPTNYFKIATNNPLNSQVSAFDVGNADAIVLGDVNGDGKTDILTYSMTNGRFYIIFSDKNGQSNSISCAVDRSLIGATHLKDNISLADFDGDGKSEIYVLLDGTISVYSINVNESSNFTLSRLSNFRIPNIPLSQAAYDDLHMILGDFNGDGKKDIFTYNSNFTNGIILSTGKELIALPSQMIFSSLNSTSSTNPSYVLTKGFTNFRGFDVVDLNKDGKDDIVMRYEFIEDLPDPNNPGETISTEYDKLAVFQNLNFNFTHDYAVDDIFDMPQNPRYQNFDGTAAVNILSATKYYRNSIAYHAITSIVNGLNAETKIEYKPITDLTVYAKGRVATYPLVSAQFPMNVVYSVKTSDGLNVSPLLSTSFP